MSQAAARPHGLSMDRRETADAVEVAVSFRVVDGRHRWSGERLSRRYLTVRPEGGLPADAQPAPRPVEAHFTLNGFDLVLPMLVRSQPPAAPGGPWRLTIAELDYRTDAALRHMVRSLLVGWLPSAEDMVRGWDEETPAPVAAPTRPRRRWLALPASLLLLALGAATAGYQAYIALTQVRASAAAVTAQRIDIVSPEFGRVAVAPPTIGSTLAPGDIVARVSSPQLEADLATALPGDLALATDAAVAPEAAVWGRIRALQRRLDALTFRATCTCRLLWAAAADSSVAPGGLLASLVVVDPDKLRIEALVPWAAATTLRVGHRAAVSWIDSTASIGGAIEQIRYETSPVPRVGLGVDRGQLVTVTVRLDEPSLAPPPGTPVNVLLFK